MRTNPFPIDLGLIRLEVCQDRSRYMGALVFGDSVVVRINPNGYATLSGRYVAAPPYNAQTDFDVAGIMHVFHSMAAVSDNIQSFLVKMTAFEMPSNDIMFPDSIATSGDFAAKLYSFYEHRKPPMTHIPMVEGGAIELVDFSPASFKSADPERVALDYAARKLRAGGYEPMPYPGGEITYLRLTAQDIQKRLARTLDIRPNAL